MVALQPNSPVLANAWLRHLGLSGTRPTTGVLAPALQIGAALYLLLALRMRRVPRGFAGAFRLFRQAAPWAMVEVFALGVLVSMVKLAHVATI